MTNAVVVIGSFNVDHVWAVDTLPRPGETLAGRYHSGPGGKGFNQAVAATRAGASTRFICALGEDEGARLALSLADAEHIEMMALRTDVATGTAGILVDADGRNSIVVGSGANAVLDAAFVQGEAARISDACVVLGQLESPAAAVEAAFAIARRHGLTTLLNPAPADAVVPDALWALADIATPNETEFGMQLKRRCGIDIDPDALSGQPDEALHALCRDLLPHGCVIVTLGAAGAFVSHPDGAWRGDARAFQRIAAPRVDVVDTTGAGDAFNGALAAAIALDPERKMADHVIQAARFASLSTEHAGAALSMPTREGVRARFPSCDH